MAAHPAGRENKLLYFRETNTSTGKNSPLRAQLNVQTTTYLSKDNPSITGASLFFSFLSAFLLLILLISFTPPLISHLSSLLPLPQKEKERKASNIRKKLNRVNLSRK